MTKRTFCLVALIAAGILLTSTNGVAQDQQRSQEQMRIQAQDQEQIYGSELMTPEERADFRERIRTATSEEERQRIRQEHHEQMRERAQRQGITLPDEPPERGMRRGMGPGGGMSPRDGMGSGGMGGGRR